MNWFTYIKDLLSITLRRVNVVGAFVLIRLAKPRKDVRVNDIRIIGREKVTQETFLSFIAAR